MGRCPPQRVDEAAEGEYAFNGLNKQDVRRIPAAQVPATASYDTVRHCEANPC